jgi:hypothetical protein
LVDIRKWLLIRFRATKSPPASPQEFCLFALKMRGVLSFFPCDKKMSDGMELAHLSFLSSWIIHPPTGGDSGDFNQHERIKFLANFALGEVQVEDTGI